MGKVDWVGVLFILAVCFVLPIMFMGEPDLHDAIIDRVMECR